MPAVPNALPLLRFLRSLPYVRGRDRAVDALARTLPRELQIELDGLRYWVDTRETTQLDLATRGHLEPLTVAALRRLLRPGDTAIDVGAHAGVLTMEMARAVGPSGRVIAIEPQPACGDRIMRNAVLNGFEQVTTVCAVANFEGGWQTLNYQRETDRSRLSLCAEQPSATSYRFQVPGTHIAHQIYERGDSRVRVLKVDVEGYELEVLRGCRDRIGFIDAVIVELLRGSDHSATLDLLRVAGYTLQTVTGAPFESVDALPEHNLLAVRT